MHSDVCQPMSHWQWPNVTVYCGSPYIIWLILDSILWEISYRLLQHDVHFLRTSSAVDIVPKWSYYSFWKPTRQFFYSILNHLKNNFSMTFKWPMMTHRKSKQNHQLRQRRNRHIVRILQFHPWFAIVLRMVLYEFENVFNNKKSLFGYPFVIQKFVYEFT